MMAFRHRTKPRPRTVYLFAPSASPTPNPDGGMPEDAGNPIGKRRAAIQATTGGEAFVGDQQTGNVTHLVRMHPDSKTRLLTNRNWMTLEDRTTRLDIVRSYPRQDTGEIECQCIQRVSGGVDANVPGGS